jgi:hypothetical protein
MDKLFWCADWQTWACEEHLPSRGGEEVDELRDGEEECGFCQIKEKRKQYLATHSYVDEVCIEVWGDKDIHLVDTNRREFLDAMGKLWDSHQIDCSKDDGYEPGPIKLMLSIEPEAK